MTSSIAPPRFSPELRVSTFYFFQSMSVGAVNAFAGIWLSAAGLNEQQIGIIYAAPIVVLLVISLTLGRIADRARDWRQVIIIGAVASGIFPVGLFFVTGFSGILVFWTLAVVAQWGVTPVTDAAALRMARRRGSDFGTFRAWGTVSYLMVILICGYALERFGTPLFLPLFVTLCLMRSLASFGLPKLRAGEKQVAPKSGAVHLLHVMKPWFVLPLIGWSLVYSTHLTLNAFLGLVLKQQGLPTDIIGMLIALSAASEAVLFFTFKRFATRFSARNLILISCLTSVLRWVAMSFGPGIEVLVLLQLLHSVTYALGFIACVNFIANWTNEEIAAEAQGFFTVLQLATGIITVLVFGSLAGAWGAKAFLASAFVSALGAALVWLSTRLKHPER
jgi:PPP family 3-phenylpropionic acid transporter